MIEKYFTLISHRLIKWFSPIRNQSRSLLFSLVAILILANSCGDEENAVVVDFSKTAPVERPKNPPTANSSLRVAVAAMVSPKETFIYYRQLLDYIGKHLDKNVELIQRKTYSEINEIFRKGQIDLAFLCSGPYATGKGEYGFELIATPQVQGSPFYQAYLTVNKDSMFDKLEDLRNHVFAFTDPDSNTGELVPKYWLSQIGESPESFFSKTVYTYSHDNAIMAVAKALVDGASVDSLIWEYLQSKTPAFTSKTRIIKKSDQYGNPPLVVSKNLPQSLKVQIGQLIFSMHSDPEGREILRSLMIDRFIKPRDEWYTGIKRMADTLVTAQEKTHGF